MKLKNSPSPLVISGEVFAHTGRGTSLGYPTANFVLNQPIEHGVYISQTWVDGNWHASVTFIGVPKTFSEQSLERAETHILNGTFKLVGETISVELIKFLRQNKKFPSIQELIVAIQQDIAQARTYFLANS